MAEKPQVRIRKGNLYKMVSYKGAEGEFGSGMKGVISGMNSMGATLNSISLTVENLTNVMKSQVSAQISAQGRVEQAEAKRDNDKETERKRELINQKREDAKERRNKSEGLSERDPVFKKIAGGIFKAGKAATKGLLKTLADLAGTFLMYAAGFGILDWLSKNPEKIKKLAETLAAVGKFIWNLTSNLVSGSLDGLVKFLNDPTGLSGMMGVAQFLLNAAPLFLGIAILKNPLMAVNAVSWLIRTLASGIMNIGGLGKFKTFAAAGGAAALAMYGASQDGLEKSAVIGAGVGAAGGTLVGAKVGEMTGIPGMGMLLGAAGGAAGTEIGKKIGPMLEPLIEPITKFFGMVGEIAQQVLAPVKDLFGDFFKALGDFMMGVLDAIEPHMPMISKIIGIGVQVAFAPLFLGIKALTEVMKFFAAKGEDAASQLEGKAKGGLVQPSGRAAGGWISGPMSGYPVSLDGGRSTAFIGHGTEWVGTKGYSKGGAYVVPFNTPTTKQIPRLTRMRMREAMRGGYAMPKFSMGGAVNVTIPAFSEGGKFDPSTYAKGATTTSGLVLNDKTYYVQYQPKDDGELVLKHMSKRLSAGLFGSNEKRISVKPGSDEMKAVLESKGFKDFVAKKHTKTIGTGKSKKKKSYQIKKISMDPMINDKYAYHEQARLAEIAAKAEGVPTAKAEEIASTEAAASTQPTQAKVDKPSADSVEGITEMLKKGLTKFSGTMGEVLGAKQGLAMEEGKQKATERKNTTAQPIVINKTQQAPAVNSGGGEDVPFIIPNTSITGLDSDAYMQPRFGLVAEFSNDVVDFM